MPPRPAQFFLVRVHLLRPLKGFFPKGAIRSDRGTFLLQDWKPTPDNAAFAIDELGSDEVARREREKFRNYRFARSGADGRKRDWQATWRNWVMKAADHGTGHRNGPSAQLALAQSA
ncbi:MAG: hypothetical protein COT28_18465 [Methylobacterium sp. CG08_land_8_20_14_0_20_71_15]|uniref:Uncharacterized protein n=2 Tax=Methylobacteriaceae TaxID=119045 RepID=A0ABQ4SXX9_9HYPH|nr:MAG: hypothetical protein COT56_11355 [Methylobacterium sp. CG09_land_8_20_14_0_10_71_15]PIU11751.1 MAG: hypothetical protein COT28_18465 [Methylobacterium sp. CG08_land_8_20_14_0_20_71_15]GBU18808.1 hypothetical protein AwMethylo_30230 [Methylobacterium sp.]GJE07081.1 hypothetical protein AOPFMNJM_2405 [Methylobacterium jeotgali]